MSDLSNAITPKVDQLTADDLIAGPITIDITGVSVVASPEQPVAVSFDGDGGRPWKPCKSMTRVLVHLWGPDSATFAGRSLTLYRDPTVQFGGMAIGGIRVSHMSHINGRQTLALTAKKGQKKPFVVLPLAAAPVTPPPAPAAQAPTQGPSTFPNRLQSALDKCQTGDAVFTVIGKQSVKDALANAPQDVRDQINTMIRLAHERFMPPMDPQPGAGPDGDEGFGVGEGEGA